LVPAGKLIHVILDNYCNLQAPEGAGLAGTVSTLDLPLHTDFRPVDERSRRSLFSIDTAQDEAEYLERNVSLQAAINLYIVEQNDRPKPFVWTKRAAAILDAVNNNSALSE
jgi:hypothetical protein